MVFTTHIITDHITETIIIATTGLIEVVIIIEVPEPLIEIIVLHQEEHIAPITEKLLHQEDLQIHTDEVTTAVFVPLEAHDHQELQEEHDLQETRITGIQKDTTLTEKGVQEVVEILIEVTVAVLQKTTELLKVHLQNHLKEVIVQKAIQHPAGVLVAIQLHQETAAAEVLQVTEAQEVEVQEAVDDNPSKLSNKFLN